MNLISFTEFSANWSDLVSLLLLLPTVLSNRLEPRNPLRGFPFPQHLLHVITMSALLSFSIFRYIFEGVFSIFTHRQFLTISALYIIRWFYHFYKLHNSSNPECRLSRVAKAVADVSTIRVGKSTFHGRKGQQEIVVRKGTNKANGTPYWRGTIQVQKRVGDVWIVHLDDEHIHEDSLSAITKFSYANDQHDSLDDLYQRIFRTVMTVEGAGDSHIDWSLFFAQYSAITKTKFAERVCAMDDSELAGVARRIAADACCYVSGRGDFRTEEQVQLVNLCVEKAVQETMEDLA